MNKTIINVPKGIRFMTQWNEFKLPETPTIINKQLCGCGFTEWCLCSPYNIILCSPRKMLLENKADQHSLDSNILYARNELELVINTDKDLSKIVPSAKNDNQDYLEKQKEAIKKAVDELHRKVEEHVTRCFIQRVPCKIIVTYDSFRHVREVLGNFFKEFYVVVDEFQSIFTDARFKSSTEIEFLNTLQGFDRLCFVSATPMVDEYLAEMEEFKDLPFWELDWKALDPGRVIKPKLNIFPCRSILKAAEKEIQDYLGEKFKKKVIADQDGNIVREVESRELVIYVNSVNNICEIIRKNGLNLNNTNVLCARTPDNFKKVKDAFNSVIRAKNEDKKAKDIRPLLLTDAHPIIGKVPKKGEYHKMFTLCTRTVYLGADFYSKCARSVVLSDANSDCMSVDISLDLPQIIGRQRLEENPWLNMADFYFKTSIRTQKELEEFKGEINEKIEKTNDLLLSYDSTPTDSAKSTLADTYEYVAKSKNYKDDYVSVNRHAGSGKIPVFNKLMMLSEIRTYEIQKLDYKDRFSVLAVVSYNNDIENTDSIDGLNEFNSYTQFTDKMRVLCNNPELLDLVPFEYSNYFYLLGPERIKACQFRKYLMDDELNKLRSVQNNVGNLRDVIYSTFNIGSVYSKSDIKDKIATIYENLGIKVTPKALVIKDYFEVKDVMKTNKETGKRDNGFLIIKKKGD